MLGSADAASLMSVLGGLTVYGSNNPVGEFRGRVLGTHFSSGHASLAGTILFAFAGSVSFVLNLGDSIYVWASLTVYADSSHEVIGAVDAAQTLAMKYVAGDTTMLGASVGSVPEPASAALLAGGMGVILLLARHRNARQRAR